MNFTLALIILSSVVGHANAALRDSNVLVIASDESESPHDTPKLVEDPRSFYSDQDCDPSCGSEERRFCEASTSNIIGCNSCLGERACASSNGYSIGDNSCHQESSCEESNAVIGNNSCNDIGACLGATGYIGNNQCNNKNECQGKHFPALSLYNLPFEGGCRSSNGKSFSDVRIDTKHLSEDSAEACATFCRHPRLTIVLMGLPYSLVITYAQVGMQFGDNTCFCKYDGKGELPSSIPDGASKHIKEGYGPVAGGGKPYKNLKCYPMKVGSKQNASGNYQLVRGVRECPSGFAVPKDECLEAAKVVGSEYNIENHLFGNNWVHNPCGCFIWGPFTDGSIKAYYDSRTGCTGAPHTKNLGMVCKKAEEKELQQWRSNNADDKKGIAEF